MGQETHGELVMRRLRGRFCFTQTRKNVFTLAFSNKQSGLQITVADGLSYDEMSSTMEALNAILDDLKKEMVENDSKDSSV